MSKAQVSVLLCTCPDLKTGQAIAHTLLEERLVACINIVEGVRSLYRWQGQICDDSECLLIMKTTENTVEKLTNRIPAIHPYDVPEVLALDTSSGHIPYLDWVVSSVEPESNTVSN